MVVAHAVEQAELQKKCVVALRTRVLERQVAEPAKPDMRGRGAGRGVQSPPRTAG
jgi:hypothetical protein